jgi:UPF0716 protein FxsA
MRARLMIFGYPLAEAITAYLVAMLIGWGWMFLLLLVGIPCGVWLMRHARTPAGLVAGLLVAIPGFLTDVAGLVLLLPPIQRPLSQRAQDWAQARTFPGMVNPTWHDNAGTGGFASPAAGGDVIQGVVIDHSDDERPER